MRHLLKISLLLVVLAASTKLQAQDTYRTQDGTMVIKAVAADTILTLTTKKLLVFLNYSNARFTMKMDISDFYTDNDSLNKQLALMKYEIIEYAGKFDLVEINSSMHSPVEFNVEGVLSTNSRIIKGTGRLEHYSTRGHYSCLLTLRFNLKVVDLGLELEGLHLGDEVEINVVQMILNSSEDY